MLSDSDKLRNVASKKKRPLTGVNNMHYSDSQKLEAVTTYLALGNLTLTASVLKIPEMTLRTWKKRDWWKEIEGELRVQDDIQLSSRLRRIIDSTLEVTEDRIKNGDFIYDNKTGELIRKPVLMKDAHKVTMDMIAKREHLDGKAPANVNMEQIDDRLKKLAEKFEQIAAGRRPLEVTDVIVGSEFVNGEEVGDDDANIDDPTP